MVLWFAGRVSFAGSLNRFVRSAPCVLVCGSDWVRSGWFCTFWFRAVFAQRTAVSRSRCLVRAWDTSHTFHLVVRVPAFLTDVLLHVRNRCWVRTFLHVALLACSPRCSARSRFTVHICTTPALRIVPAPLPPSRRYLDLCTAPHRSLPPPARYAVVALSRFIPFVDLVHDVDMGSAGRAERFACRWFLCRLLISVNTPYVALLHAVLRLRFTTARFSCASRYRPIATWFIVLFLAPQHLALACCCVPCALSRRGRSL